MNRQVPPPPAAEGTATVPPHEAAFLAAWRQQLTVAWHRPWLARPWLTHSRDLVQRFTRTYDHLRQQPRHVRRRIQRQWGASLAGAALALALLNAPAYAVPPTGITVDGTTCTLVDAITAANTDAATNGCAAGNGADTITLQTDVTLTTSNNFSYNDNNGLPVINSAITIEGAGHTIRRDAGAAGFRLLAVGSSGNLTLHQTTLSGGNITNGGGGIFNRGTATVSNSTLSDNTTSIQGGGIFNDHGSLAVSNSTLSGNTTTRGGGIYNNYGTVTVSNSTLSGNTGSDYGGGIYNNGGTLNLAHSLISGNSAGSRGAEIYNYNGTVNAANFNLIGYGGDARSFSFTPSGSDIVPSQALAAILNTTLANNGGGTLTLALVTGSPAIDAAGGSGLIATDQRGITRPQGAADDIGAFELEKVSANLGLQGSPTTAFNATPDGTFGSQSPAGVFTITATFRNTANPAVNLHDVYFVVTQIHHSNGDNYLLSADNPPGQVGATQSVANSAFGGDNLWNHNEDLPTTFRIGLTERRRFAFFVDVYGISSAVTAAGASTTPQLIGHFTFTVDPNEADGQGQTLFLPLVTR